MIHLVTPDMTVGAVVGEILNAKKVGAVLVMIRARLVGIFTERDVLAVWLGVTAIRIRLGSGRS